MIRVFASTQPGVLTMLALEPDVTDFLQYVELLGRPFYLARRGDGWVLYKPSFLRDMP